MGVPGLHTWILKNVPRSTDIIQKGSLLPHEKCLIPKDAIIAVDASIYIYKFFVNNDYNLLHNGIVTMIEDFKRRNIKLLFVFDGKPPGIKDSTIDDRREAKNDAKLLYNNTSNNEEKKKLEKMFIEVTPETIDFVKKILNRKKLQFIEATNEADPECASLVIKKKCWACLSDDTDMFIYGCPRVLRCYSIKTKTFMFYPLDKILGHLKLNLTEFREICVISGTDYNTAQSIEIEKVFELFKEFRKYKKIHNNSESFINWFENNNPIKIDNNYMEVLTLMDINNYHFTTAVRTAVTTV
jgi:flap endonuclease-1